jgi:hypothetical protein
LPTRLNPLSDSADRANRPFTVLFGSCFHYPDDNGRTSAAYSKIYGNQNERPHVKIFLGDQVYLDQPPTDFVIRQDMNWLSTHMANEYIATWNALRDMLSRGGNIFASDDHEYWNDFPFPPAPVWAALAASGDYRHSYRSLAEKYFKGIQSESPTVQFSVGDGVTSSQVSFFVADTRINRSANDQRFMSEDDLLALERWIENLKGPGVLALGGPLFYQQRNRWNGIYTSDHNIPYFRQYYDLVRALSKSRYDLMVLAGDVHFGRIAKSEILTTDGHKRALIEVVSSPLSLLNTDNHSSGGRATARGPQFGPNAKFPKHAVGSVRQADTTLIKVVRCSSEWPIPRELVQQNPHLTPEEIREAYANRTAEHFMTLQFSDGASPGDVRVSVKAWLIREETSSMLPELDWEWTGELRKSVDGAPAPDCSVAVSVTPPNSGAAAGGGTYARGQRVTLRVVHLNPGFRFSHWSESGSTVSREATWSFNIDRDRSLKAHLTSGGYPEDAP